MVEDRLPFSILSKVRRTGSDLLWRPGDVPSVIDAVEKAGGVVRSVVAQFDTPDGTLEPVHTQRALGLRPRGETEAEYAARSVVWARAAFAELMREDFADIVRRQPDFLDDLAPEDAVAQYLSFILGLSEPEHYL